jgi:hypothetical protein
LRCRKPGNDYYTISVSPDNQPLVGGGTFKSAN